MGELEPLYNYTVFHIGLYFTVAGGIVAVLNLEVFSKGIPSRTEVGLIVSISLLIVAGAFGSVVASSITRTVQPLDQFLASNIGPIWCPKMIPASWAIGFEHGAFWLAIALLFATIATSNKGADV